MVILFLCGEELEINEKHFPLKIRFNGKEYVIKITKNGKLIMN